jgi:hypothetical protein
VRNTYKVLLTRGMLGSVVFSTDPETQGLLGGLLRGEVTPAVRQATASTGLARQVTGTSATRGRCSTTRCPAATSSLIPRAWR